MQKKTSNVRFCGTEQMKVENANLPEPLPQIQYCYLLHKNDFWSLWGIDIRYNFPNIQE